MSRFNESGFVPYHLWVNVLSDDYRFCEIPFMDQHSTCSNDSAICHDPFLGQDRAVVTTLDFLTYHFLANICPAVTSPDGFLLNFPKEISSVMFADALSLTSPAVCAPETLAPGSSPLAPSPLIPRHSPA